MVLLLSTVLVLCNTVSTVQYALNIISKLKVYTEHTSTKKEQEHAWIKINDKEWKRNNYSITENHFTTSNICMILAPNTLTKHKHYINCKIKKVFSMFTHSDYWPWYLISWKDNNIISLKNVLFNRHLKIECTLTSLTAGKLVYGYLHRLYVYMCTCIYRGTATRV